MIPPFQLKQAGLTHLEELTELFDAYRVFYNQASDLDRAREFVRERLTQNDTVFFLAVNRAEKGCGFVHLFPIFTSVGTQKHWLLNDLFVSPDQRGQGLGRELIRKAKTYASQTKAKGLLLQTALDNATAQKLYENENFVRDETTCWYEWLS
ncbi:MAG: GNAT family N-acetyltransferase [Bacteroidia bacterium]